MLGSLWADCPGLRCIVSSRGRRIHHHWFETTEEALAKAVELDAEGWNVYFAPALFDPEKVRARQEETNPRTERPYTGREQATTAALPALWLDLDCGEGKDYPDQPTAARALAEWIAKCKVPKPTHIVSSGYGLHIYWRLDQPASHAQWLPVAKHLKQACRVHGLNADPSRTSDAASLLRPPGTHNHKRGRQAEVRVLHESDEGVNLQQFRASLPMVGPVGTVTPATPGGEWDTTVKLPPGDANKIASGCGQMGYVRFTRGKVDEPLWRAALSILWRCEGREELIHEWSKGDPRYDPQQTEDKAARTEGPATCRHFAEINPDGCAGCPHAGKVNSPINIAFAEELPEVEDEDKAPVHVEGYTVNKDGIFKAPLAEEGGPLTKIADFPIWIEEARELASAHTGQLRASLQLAWHDIRGHYYSQTITQAELHDPRAWTAWLANANLASFVHGPQMQQYISRMHKARYRERGARVVYDCLGWYQDHSLFVIGQQGITADGVVDVTLDTNDDIAHLHPKGSLEEWKKAAAIFAAPRYKAQAFGLLMGFAAPLLDITGKNGAVVAFVGQSGRGKTLAAEAALSVYSDPRAVQGSGRDTVNALGHFFGKLRHLPVLVDEVTTMPDKYLRDLIYMAANGADKAALNQKRERKQVMKWRTVAMLTSNHSIIDRHQKDIEEAHRRRLVEVSVLNAISREEAQTFYDIIQANHGVAAAPYLQLVMRHKGKIPALFRVMERQVEQWGYVNPADRFGAWTCAAALLGGILAYLAGVLPFNPIPVVRDVASMAAGEAETIMSPEEQAHEALFEMLTTYSRRVCVWAEGKLSVDDTDDPIARIRHRELLVRASELHKVWDEHKIYRRALTTWLKRVAPDGRAYHRLAPGTPPVSAYKFKMDELNWDAEDIKGR